MKQVFSHRLEICFNSLGFSLDFKQINSPRNLISGFKLIIKTSVQVGTIPKLTVYVPWCLLLLLRTSSAPLETLGFPMGDAYFCVA